MLNTETQKQLRKKEHKEGDIPVPPSIVATI